MGRNNGAITASMSLTRLQSQEQLKRVAANRGPHCEDSEDGFSS